MIGSVNSYTSVVASYRSDMAATAVQTATPSAANSATASPGIAYFSPEGKFDSASQKLVLVYVNNSTGETVNQIPSVQQLEVYRRQAAAAEEQKAQSATQTPSTSTMSGAVTATGGAAATVSANASSNGASSSAAQYSGSGSTVSNVAAAPTVVTVVTTTVAAPATPTAAAAQTGTGSAQLVNLSA